MAEGELTITLSGEAVHRLRRLAEESGHPPEVYLAVMLEDHFDDEMAEIAELKRIVERIDAGHTVPHEEATRRIRAAIDRAGQDAAE